MRLLWIDRLEVFHVPGVDHVGFDLGCAPEQKRVVNASAGESAFRGLLDGLEVFVLIETDDSKAVAHFLNEKKGLIGRYNVLDRQCRHSGVDFRQCVHSARGLLVVGCGDSLEAGVVLAMTAPEGRDENRGVEELLDPNNSRRRFDRTLSITEVTEASVGSPW